jgi:hypothetical protein
MLMADKKSWFGFIESGHLLLIGRALGAILISIHCRFLDQISDFAASRFIAFLALLVFTAFLCRRFHKFYNMEPFWSKSLGFVFFLLPSNQLFILWAGNFIPGPFNLFVASCSYLFLECGWNQILIAKKYLKFFPSLLLMISFCIFIASLFIYPPTALFVFVFTLASILFSTEAQRRQIWFILIRDVLFFGMAMCIYWMLDRRFIYSLAINSGHFLIPRQPEYKMAITFNIGLKVPLIKETLLSSFAGTWHLVLGKNGSVITLSLLALSFLLMIYFKRFPHRTKKQAKINQPSQKFFHLIQRAFAGVILFFVGNLPPILAEGILAVQGYRVLLVGSMMTVMWQFYLMRINDQLVWNRFQSSLVKTIAIVLIVSYGFLTAGNVRNAVWNYHRELIFIRSKIASCDYTHTRGFVVRMIPRGETLIPRRLPYEFGFMITDHQHVEPILKEALRQKGFPMLPFLLLPPDSVVDKKLAAQGICIIDLNELRYNPSNPKTIEYPIAKPLWLKTFFR